jgi:hypothetical protein
MGTRSTIATQNPDGTITAIYCHWDGYPEGVGKTLQEHYTNPDKVAQLMALGDLSALGPEIGESNDFGNPDFTVCLSYRRDREDDDEVDAIHFDSKREWISHYCRWVQYAYLFDPASGWKQVDINHTGDDL